MALEIILGLVGSLGSVVDNIVTAPSKVEIAKYQAEIAKSQATTEEKKYALLLAEKRLAEIRADEEKASKAKNTKIYIFGGLGFLLLLTTIFLIFRKKQAIIQTVQPVTQNQAFVPKPPVNILSGIVRNKGKQEIQED